VFVSSDIILDTLLQAAGNAATDSTQGHRDAPRRPVDRAEQHGPQGRLVGAGGERLQAGLVEQLAIDVASAEFEGLLLRRVHQDLGDRDELGFGLAQGESGLPDKEIAEAFARLVQRVARRPVVDDAQACPLAAQLAAKLVVLFGVHLGKTDDEQVRGSLEVRPDLVGHDAFQFLGHR